MIECNVYTVYRLVVCIYSVCEWWMYCLSVYVLRVVGSKLKIAPESLGRGFELIPTGGWTIRRLRTNSTFIKSRPQAQQYYKSYNSATQIKPLLIIIIRLLVESGIAVFIAIFFSIILKEPVFLLFSRFHQSLKLSELQKRKLKLSNIMNQTVRQEKEFLVMGFMKQPKPNIIIYVGNVISLHLKRAKNFIFMQSI